MFCPRARDKYTIIFVIFLYSAQSKLPQTIDNWIILFDIPDIKIKKVVLPESLNRINKYIRLTRSSLLDTKGKRVLSNNPSMTQKYYLKNSENNTTSKNRRTSFNVTCIKHKNSRSKGFKLIESARILNGRQNSMKSDINSSAAVKTKYQNNILNSAHNIRRNQNRNWSFEKNKNEKERFK